MEMESFPFLFEVFPKKFLVQKTLGTKKFGQKNLVTKILFQKIFGYFWIKKVKKNGSEK